MPTKKIVLLGSRILAVCILGCLFRDRRGRVGRKPHSTASVLGPAITCWSSWSVSFFYFLCRNYRFLFHFPILLARVETGRCPVRRNVRYLDRRQPSRVAFFPLVEIPTRNDRCPIFARCDF